MSPRRHLDALFAKTPGIRDDSINGTQAANRAVANCAPGSSIIFLTRSEYEDLIFRAFLAELKTYKGKLIIITSDPISDLDENI